jgi:L-rhamnose mutarotase
MVIGLRPEHEAVYKETYRAVREGVLHMIRQCHIDSYSIYLGNSILYSYFEYFGETSRWTWPEWRQIRQHRTGGAALNLCRYHLTNVPLASGGPPWKRCTTSINL